MTITTITSTVRGGGSGRNAWVARITGTSDKYGFDREFVAKDGNLSGSAKSGYIDFNIDEPGIYEVRGVQLPKGEASIGDLWNGFISVAENGDVAKIDKSEINL